MLRVMLILKCIFCLYTLNHKPDQKPRTLNPKSETRNSRP